MIGKLVNSNDGERIMISYNNDLMSAKLKRNALWAAIWLLLLVSTVAGFSFKQVKITASTYTTNVIATYTAFYDRTTTNSYTTTNYSSSPLNSSSTVTLNFPLQYALTNTVVCSYQINSTGPYTTTPCNQLGNQITLNTIFPNGTILASLTLLITNVLNPYPAGKTSNFSGTIGADTAVANGVNSLVTITPATSVCSFTFSPNLVYSIESMVFTLTLTNQFPVGGTIGVQFPLTRLWSQQLDSTRLMPITPSMNCNSQSANVNSAIQCTGSTSFAVVTFSNVVTTTLSPGSTISFSIANFIAPPTNQPADSIVLTTYTGSSAIDTCNAYVGGLQPLTIPSTQFIITEVNNAPMVVNQQYTIKFDIITLSIISLADAVVITFPAGTSISNFGSATLGGTISFNQASSSYYGQVLTLYLAGGPGILGSGEIFITVSNFVAPPNTLTTNNFQLQIVSNNYPRMISSNSIQAVTGTLTGTVSMGTTTVNALSAYTFTITTANPITSGGFIVINFPASLGLSASTSAIATGNGLASAPTCTYTAATNSLTITNLNSTSGNIPAQTFTLMINGITNPPSTTTTGTFRLTTYYNGTISAAVDSGTISGVTATAAAIDYTKIVVSSSSFITSDTTVTYYFSFLVQNPIPAGGFVIVNFPTAIVFDLATANNNCQLMVNSGTPTSTPCTAALGTSYVFNFTNPFPSTPAAVGTNLTFAILSAATNPPTTQPVSPFSVSTYYSDGSSIAAAANVSSYSNITIPSAFTTNLISKLSNKNAEYTSYTLTLTQIATLEGGAMIKVVFPSSLLPQPSSTCSINYLGTTTVACGFISNTFRVFSITTAIAGGATFSITFTNIRNALSFAPVSGFQVTTKSSGDLYFYSSSSSTNSVSNSIPTQFAALTYQYSPQQLSSAISLQVSFQLSQYTVMPGSLQISIDSYFTVTNLTCSAFIDFAATCTSLTTNTLKITGSFNNSVMGFTVSGFASPSAAPSTPTFTTLGSFDSAGFKIDQSTNNISFALNCALPCKTCSGTNASSCISCYSSTAITPSIFLYSPFKNCYTNCPATTYNNNVTLICTPCDSNCYTCLASPTFCTKCIANSTYPFLSIVNSSQFCVAQCSTGMYGSTAIDPASCVACVSPCASCSSATVCLSCLPGYYFLNGTTCTTNCTPQITVPNVISHTCDPCNPICLTCSGSVGSCTACNSPLVFYNGSCQTGCPSGGTLAPLNGICTACVSTCQTCSLTIYNCVSCNLGSATPFLVNGSCIASCPTYFYNDTSTGSCYSCAASNQSCINCASATLCLSCDTSFVLYNGKCINYVPAGYVNISGVAVACTGDCATCSITTGNCTSCKNLSLQGYSCVSNCSTGTISVLQNCVACSSPCLTCSGTQTTCNSCVANLNPPRFLSGTTCQTNCPPYFYPDLSTSTCVACTNNCSTCTSATSCSTCLAGTYLYNNICMTVCPSGYVGITSTCQACTNNCKTCAGGTNICLTCNANTYYLAVSQSCISACPTGLFLDSPTQTCVGCSSSCLTCAGSATTCTACNSSLLFNSQCITSCPSGMYPQLGTCVSCPSTCATCSSASNCSVCAGANYLYNGQCVGTCPATSGQVINGACAACSGQNCYSCTSGNVCLSCSSGFLFLNAICVLNCPTGYSSNGTNCVSVLEQTLTSSPPNNSFPVPFTIGGIVLIIACLMSRLQFPQTYLSGAIYSLISVLEWCALWYFLYLYFIQYMGEPVAEYIGLGAMGFLYIMNITSWIAQSVFLCYEKEFVAWTSESRFHKCFYWFTGLISLVANHKFKNILFCKLFTFKVFSARLDRVDHFRIFNIFSLISLIHSGGAIFAAGIALTKTNSREQLFHECIDVIVLTGLNVVLAFFNTHKDKDFFEETTADGYSLHKKNNLMEEHLVPSKEHGLGEDGEVEEGYINDYNHALTSKQAFKMTPHEEAEVGAGYSDSSLADLTEKQQEYSLSQKSYEQVSVQALDLLDTRTDKQNVTAKTNLLPKPTYEEISIQADSLIHEQEQKGVDFSALPPQGFDQDSSAYTNYFPRVNKSVQGNLDRGVNVSAQVGAELTDKSMQNDGRLGDAVDYSVQKSESIRRADQSMQYSRGQPRDASFQISRNQFDQSVNVSHRSRSFGVQQYQTVSEKGIAANVSMHSQANQLSEISQEDEQIQMAPEAEEIGIQRTINYDDVAIQPSIQWQDDAVQPTIQFQDAAIQPTVQFQDVAIQPQIDYQDVAIQPDLEYNEVAVQPSLQPSANQMAIQYEPIEQVHYDELEQELGHSNTNSNVLFETEEQHAQERQLAEEQVEELQIRNQNMRSYQEELEERIRNKEKELQEIRRKVDFRQRHNAAKKEELADSIHEQDIDLQGITYVEQRPSLPRPQRLPTAQPEPDRLSSSSSNQLMEEIQVKRDQESIQLGIESKQMPKEQPRQPQLNASQSSASSPLNETLQEIKVFKQPNQVIIAQQQQEKSPSFKKQPSERISNREPSERFAVFKEPSERIVSRQAMEPAALPKQPSERLISFKAPSQRVASKQPSEHSSPIDPSEHVLPYLLSPQREPSQKAPSERLHAAKQPSERLPAQKEPSERLPAQKEPSERLAHKEPSERLLQKEPSRHESIRQPSERMPSFKESDRVPLYKEASNKQASFKESSAVSGSKREKTIEEFMAEEIPVRDRDESKRQKTIEEIRLQDVRPPRAVVDAIETRSEFARTKPLPEKKQIEYKEYDNELLSQDSEEQKNVFIRSNEQPTPKRNDKAKQQLLEQQERPRQQYIQQQQQQPQPRQQPIQQQREVVRSRQPEIPRNIEVRDMGNMELETGSQADNDYQVSNLSSSHHSNNQLEDRQHPQIEIIHQEDEALQEEYKEEERSQGNRESEATRKNYYQPNKRNVVIDVTEIDQSLLGEEDYVELEEASQSDHEPTGIVNAYHAKPNFNQEREREHSDLSGTIEEIPHHQLAFDDQKTISNPDVPQRPPRPEISQQQLTNIFAGSLPANQKVKKNNLPADSEPEHFRINRLYANNTASNLPLTSRNQEALPRNVLQRERKSTLAQAGRAQLVQDKLAQKKSTGRSPLKVTRQWQAQHEDKYVEEEEFAPTNNRNNLVRRPANLQNFASHLVLPQETDKQDTSFQHPKRDILSGKQETQHLKAPMSGKLREPPKQPEEIQVHFEADQLSRDLSLTDKNRSPEMPRAYGRQPSRQESSLGGEEEGDDVDYRQLMMLGQMQERPRNGDLQEYYRKQSKEKRRKSNSKLDRSTEKIYMQKLDKKR